MKLLTLKHSTQINDSTKIWIGLGIELVTIFVLLKFALVINSQPSITLGGVGLGSENQSYMLHMRKYYFLALLFTVIIIHNLVIGGWHSPKDFIFVCALLILGVWVWHNSANITNANTNMFTRIEGFFTGKSKNKTTQPSTTTTRAETHNIQELGYEDMDYNLPNPGTNTGSRSAELVGTDLLDAHPTVNEDELVWGNKPEHYDFVPDDIPGYLDLPQLRKLKRLQKKVKKDKNYKYLAKIKPYDPQSMHRSDGDPGSELMLHRHHGLDNLFLENAEQHKAYGMPKEVLDALSNSPYGVWKEGPKQSSDVNGQGKYIRRNGVGNSWYKFLKEPEPTLTPDAAVVCNSLTTTTTRPDGLKTSPDTGTGPVMKLPQIDDEMQQANSKFRTAEYFTNPRVPVNDTMPRLRTESDNNQYSLYSDAINQRLPGSSDKISEYATNYPLVSLESLAKINDNCARRLDGSCLAN